MKEWMKRLLAVSLALALAVGLLPRMTGAVAMEEEPWHDQAPEDAEQQPGDDWDEEPELPPPPVYSLTPAGGDDPYYGAVERAMGKPAVAMYRLTTGVYYAVVETETGYGGVLAKGSRKNGSVVWDLRWDGEPAAESDLVAYAAQVDGVSNVKLEYGVLTGATTASVTSYLTNALNNMDGVTPNDLAKTELARFLEAAVAALGVGTVESERNKLTLDAAAASEAVDAAVSAWRSFSGVLKNAGVELNKSVELNAQITWLDADTEKRCEITVAEDLVDGVGNVVLRVFLANGQRYVRFRPAVLTTLRDSLGVFGVRLTREKSSLYVINFVDQDGNVLSSIDAPVAVGLPATTPTSTVKVTHDGESENWGGQFDPNAQTISFETSYSGTYEVLENDMDIPDIDGLPQETRDAIEFLVARGYLELEGGAFRPDRPLNRYTFTKALVGMFFALDWSKSSTFPDVPKSSPYYYYVASAEAKSIVQGLGDGTFGGEKDITLQELMTMCGRTLYEQRGYVPPLEPDYFLQRYFVDGKDVPAWARPYTALAIREQLCTRVGELRPGEEVTRKEAAVVLYRLYQRLYEVTPIVSQAFVDDDTPPAKDNTLLIVSCACGGAVLITAAVAIILIVRSNKKVRGK